MSIINFSLSWLILLLFLHYVNKIHIVCTQNIDMVKITASDLVSISYLTIYHSSKFELEASSTAFNALWLYLNSSSIVRCRKSINLSHFRRLNRRVTGEDKSEHTEYQSQQLFVDLLRSSSVIPWTEPSLAGECTRCL